MRVMRKIILSLQVQTVCSNRDIIRVIKINQTHYSSYLRTKTIVHQLRRLAYINFLKHRYLNEIFDKHHFAFL